MLDVYSRKNRNKTVKEDKHPFVECSTLADDIKYHGGGWQSNWHFVDLPWFDQGGKPSDYPKYHFHEHNLTLAIPQLIHWLKSEPNYKESYTYKLIMQYFKDETEAKSFALRLLIHYVGDIHQPLHCSSRVDKTYPSGDEGGNLFELPFHYEVDNLHALWDSVFYEYHDSFKLVIINAQTSLLQPFNNNTWDFLQNKT